MVRSQGIREAVVAVGRSGCKKRVAWHETFHLEGRTFIGGLTTWGEVPDPAPVRGGNHHAARDLEDLRVISESDVQGQAATCAGRYGNGNGGVQVLIVYRVEAALSKRTERGQANSRVLCRQRNREQSE